MSAVAAPTATATKPAHDNRHPMSFVSYVLVVLIIPALGLFVNGLATSSALWTILGDEAHRKCSVMLIESAHL